MLSILGWAFFGWVVGTVANWFLPIRSDRQATGLEIVACGVVGSIAGGAIEAMVSGGGYRPAGLLWSIAGAVAAVWVWATLTEKSP
jgi:uncharacterized membrane protein YeaQ/YmgE (transglycosylase-associated protein family)